MRPSRMAVLLRLLVLALAATTAAVVAGPVEEHDVRSEDYYRVLGLPRDCEASLVKKHYRKLAMHWHPDKNKAPEAEANFKIIAEAYEVLSNEDARKKYDAGGKDALKPENQQQHRGGGSPFNFNFGRSAQDIFKDAFDGKDPFENFEEFFGDDFVEEVIIEEGAAANGGAPTCEDESGIVATDEKGQNYRCAEAKQFCHNAQLAEKCKRTCGKCPSAAPPPGFGAQGSLHERLRRGNLGGGLGGGLGALHDMMRGMGGGLGAGAGARSFSSSFSFSSSSSSFSSSSSSSSAGGVAERTETVIENGKRVTKTIRTGADGETHASIEESEGGVTRKRSGVKRAGEALPEGGGR